MFGCNIDFDVLLTLLNKLIKPNNALSLSRCPDKYHLVTCKRIIDFYGDALIIADCWDTYRDDNKTFI